jgi:hypothetical protein
MAEEKNIRTLKRALRELPGYEPPEALWDDIAESLHENPLQKALGDLPRYDPPGEVWAGIEDELLQRPRQGAKVVRLPGKTGLGAAAAIAILLVAAFWLISDNGGSNPEIKLSYSQETVLLPEMAQDPQEAESYFSQVLEAFEERPFLRDLVDYERLRGELEALNMARDELRGAMERFGEDADLVRQLGRVERDRSDILKELAAAI